MEFDNSSKIYCLDHSFGTSNLHTEQEKVDNIIGTMKNTYDNFAKVQNPSNILKHVTVSPSSSATLYIVFVF